MTCNTNQFNIVFMMAAFTLTELRRRIKNHLPKLLYFETREFLFSLGN